VTSLSHGIHDVADEEAAKTQKETETKLMSERNVAAAATA
jgi:hypothetical protein